MMVAVVMAIISEKFRSGEHDSSSTSHNTGNGTITARSYDTTATKGGTGRRSTVSGI